MLEEQKKVAKRFRETFGRTSLTARQKDILNEAQEVSRFTDIKNLRSELGQLLCTTLTAIEECGWKSPELVEETLQLIKSREQQYKSLSRKKKVALLGGAFNPPTVGHIQVAQFVLNVSGEFDEVWLLPCFKHMYNKEMVSPKHRLAMCELAVKVDGRIKVCDYEIKNKFAGETFHLINRLMDDPISETNNFSWIIGQDNANTFDKWYNYKELEKLIRFVVTTRKGVDVDHKVDWYLRQPHIFLRAENEIMNISSSEVREYLKHKLVCVANMKKYLGEEVWDYICKHKKMYSVGELV